MSYGLVFGALFAILSFVGFIGGLVWWVRRPISVRRKSHDVLPLFGHDRAVVYARTEDEDDDEDDRAQLIMARSPNRVAAASGTVTSTPASGGNGAAQATGRAAPRTTRASSPSWSTPSARTGYAPMPDAAMSEAAQFDGHSVRYSVPTDSTLQFLPGRLEIIGGPDAGRDIRFVRTPGRDAVDVTFGRNEGPPYRHVQLHDATVSRAHARMRFRDGRWLLSNLSDTNPVLRNGFIVDGDEDHALVEGDRVEMGEVVFRFHV
ncbi:FHA domain-containing protein [Gemmatimonas sp.]|uniref:FHA domain-containing protein n=1 Tax=Gemmatimonas sp. TaxID=1962908 RepID=UPI00398322B8